MIDKLCGWTNERWGKGLIAGTLLVVGATHFGWLSGVSDPSVPVFGNVGNVMGIVAVIGGVCLMGACCIGKSTVSEVAE